MNAIYVLTRVLSKVRVIATHLYILNVSKSISNIRVAHRVRFALQLIQKRKNVAKIFLHTDHLHLSLLPFLHSTQLLA